MTLTEWLHEETKRALQPEGSWLFDGTVKVVPFTDNLGPGLTISVPLDRIPAEVETIDVVVRP